MKRGQPIFHLGYDVAGQTVPGGGAPVVLVPGESVPVYTFEAPARAGRRTLERIAGFSLADRLIDDPDDLHIVAIGGESPCALVVTRAQMDAWLAELAAAGVAPASLLPDYLALAWQPGRWAILRSPDRVLVRYGRHEGFAAEPELAGAILEARLAALPGPEAIEIRDRRPAGAGPDAVDAAIDRAIAAGAARADAEGSLFGTPASIPDAAANLLTGDYRPLSGLLEEVRRWRPVAVAAAAVLLLAGVAAFVDLGRQEAEIARLDSEIESIYRAAFDPSGPIVDLRAQAERIVDRRIGGADGRAKAGDLPRLLGKVAPTLSNPAWEVASLRFRDGTLFIEVTTGSFETLDQLRDTLSSAALTVDTERSSATADGVTAELSVQEALLGAL